MGAEERRDAVAPATAASPVNKITVTDYYVTEADGSITRYRMHKDQLLEVEHDVPIVFEIGE